MDQYEAMIKLLLEAVKNEDGTAAGNASANTPANDEDERLIPAGPVCLQRDRNGLRTEGGH